MQNLKTFKLIKNSKNPTSQWRTREFKINKIVKGVNLGVPTGKVNNITVVDLDFYDKGDKVFDRDNSNFLNTFEEEYKSFFDTFSVKTTRGGIHMYFKYDSDIKQTANATHNIDIRNDGGYIVSCNSVVNNSSYSVVNDKDILEMPSQLKEWLMDNLYKKKTEKQITKNSKMSNATYGTYLYNFKKDEINDMLNNLDDKYWDGYENFFIYTTACKVLDCPQEWDTINKTKKGYNYNENIKIWNATNNEYNGTVVNILLNANQIKKLDYYKYKPTIMNTKKPDKTINKKKLGYTFFKDTKNYIVKSDTGTGKTTSFKHYVKKYNKNFISIVSRVSLGEEQSNSFSEFGIDTRFYKNQDKFENGQNIVITVDSIMKLYNINFSKYVIFLDEFNSIIEYLITSSTLNNTRTLVYTLLIKIINEADQIIGTDADISDIALRFLEFTTKQCVYIKNDYLHNNGVEACEIFSYNSFLEKLKGEDKFLCCCDSKTQVELLYKDLQDETVKIITSDTDEYVNLDAFDKVIFSPKIIYGLDSSIERPVYCYYKERTITPTAMVQQISRCRNITKLNFLFTKKKFREDEKTIEDVKNHLIECNTLGCNYFNILCPQIINDQYLELLSKFEYNYGCYRTNKFAHFIKLLDERGFIRNKIFEDTCVEDATEALKEMKQEKKDNFNKDDAYVVRINEILKIPYENIDDFKDFFLDRNLLEKHFNLSKYLNVDKDDLFDTIEMTNDFNAKKVKQNKMKILFLLKIRKKLKLKDLMDIKVSRIIKDDEKRDKYFKEYNTIFNNRTKKDTFDTVVEQQRYIIKMYDNLFGRNVVIKTRTTVNKKKVKNYKINKECIKQHIELYNHRNNTQENEECLFN